MLISENNWLIYSAAALIALGNGLMWPSIMSVLSQRAGEDYQGVVQGYASSLGATASIIGLVAGGFMYHWIGPWVFVLSAIVIGSIALMTRFVTDKS